LHDTIYQYQSNKHNSTADILSDFLDNNLKSIGILILATLPVGVQKHVGQQLVKLI